MIIKNTNILEVSQPNQVDNAPIQSVKYYKQQGNT